MCVQSVASRVPDTCWSCRLHPRGWLSSLVLLSSPRRGTRIIFLGPPCGPPHWSASGSQPRHFDWTRPPHLWITGKWVLISRGQVHFMIFSEEQLQSSFFSLCKFQKHTQSFRTKKKQTKKNLLFFFWFYFSIFQNKSTHNPDSQSSLRDDKQGLAGGGQCVFKGPEMWLKFSVETRWRQSPITVEAKCCQFSTEQRSNRGCEKYWRLL